MPSGGVHTIKVGWSYRADPRAASAFQASAIVEGRAVSQSRVDDVLQSEIRAGPRMPQRIERQVRRPVSEQEPEDDLSHDASADGPELRRIDLDIASDRDLDHFA